ncbi:triphosphoribosyl-dephospho-CoA synthase, partial [Natronoarchaeum mannanilyticum]
MRTPAQNAELALLLEVAGTPKPGNVDRKRDLPDLRFEHFLAGAVGAQDGLRAAGRGDPV